MSEREDLRQRLQRVQTMPELDAMRHEVAGAMRGAGPDVFREIQGWFISAKNRLKRIPLKDRTW